MSVEQESRNHNRSGPVVRAALALAVALTAGALYLGIARAEALLLDLGRFVGCL